VSNNKEIWKNVVGYEGVYEVSNLGRFKSLARIVKVRDFEYLRKERVRRIKPDAYGYIPVVLQVDGVSKTSKIHIEVAKAFIPNPKKLPEVNHKDGDKGNNCVGNLEWSTRSDNMYHASATGLRHKVKLNETKVREIRELKKQGMLNREIADIYGVCHQQISRIVRGERWKHKEVTI